MALNKNTMMADTGNSPVLRQKAASQNSPVTKPSQQVKPPAGAVTDTATRSAYPKATPEIEPNKEQPDAPAQSPGGGSGSGSGSGAATPAVPETPITPAQTTIDSSKLVGRLTEGLDPVSIDRVNKYDKQPMVDLATQQIEAARQQYNNRIDNATDQGITELRRAVNDAQAEFEAQQQQIVADELNALDNAALYAEARGDKGGIGQSQYGSIQNTAAQNRQAVRNAQTKLATDTSRQISDLRARGEFDKADAMLELTQTYLAELRNIEEFAANYNLNVDQINTAIAQWEAEYAKSVKDFTTSVEMNIANMTGAFSDGTPTLEALTANNQNLAEIAMSLLGSGMSADKLTEAQKSALAGVYGMDAAQIGAYAQMVADAAKASRSGGGYTPEVDAGNGGLSVEQILAGIGGGGGTVNQAAVGMVQNYLNKGATMDQVFAKIQQMESGAAGDRAKISSAEAEALAAWAQSQM